MPLNTTDPYKLVRLVVGLLSALLPSGAGSERADARVDTANALACSDDSLHRDLTGALKALGAVPDELDPAVLGCLLDYDSPRWLDFFSALEGDGRLPMQLRPIRLDTLTMIRRLQGRPDPLRIELVELNRGPFVGEELPRFGIWLLPALGEVESFHFRDRRPDETHASLGWHVEIRSNLREAIPTRNRFTVESSRGFCGGAVLGPGLVLGRSPRMIQGALPYSPDIEAESAPRSIDEVWPATLDVAHYRTPIEAGSYMVRVVFDPEWLWYNAGAAPTVVHASEFRSFRWSPAR